MCGGGVCSVLLLLLVARYLATIDVRIWLFYVCCSDCVGVCGNVCCVRGVMDVVFSVCIVMCGAVCARVWEV